MLKKINQEAISVLNNWKVNSITWQNYVILHEWLPADIFKLQIHIRKNKIEEVAITTSSIFGKDSSGCVHITGRGNLGILDNFS